MAQTPHRIELDTPEDQKLALINDNFDKAVQNLSDLGAKFSDVVYIIANVAAGSFINNFVSLSDTQSQYQLGIFPFKPRVDMWVDVDNTANSAYFNPFNTLTVAQLNAIVSATTMRTTTQILPSDIGTYCIQLRNLDASNHTYFLRSDVWYTQSPRTGQFT